MPDKYSDYTYVMVTGVTEYSVTKILNSKAAKYKQIKIMILDHNVDMCDSPTAPTNCDPIKITINDSEFELLQDDEYVQAQILNDNNVEWKYKQSFCWL